MCVPHPSTARPRAAACTAEPWQPAGQQWLIKYTPSKATEYESENRYTWLPVLCLTLPVEGFPCDDLRKIFSECQRMAKVPNAIQILPKNYNRLSRVHERYRQADRRQTDGRQHIANVNVNSRSLIILKNFRVVRNHV